MQWDGWGKFPFYFLPVRLEVHLLLCVKSHRRLIMFIRQLGIFAAVVAIIGFFLSMVLPPGTPVHVAAAYPTVLGGLFAFGLLVLFRPLSGR